MMHRLETPLARGLCFWALACAIAAAPAQPVAERAVAARAPDVRYEPTAPDVAEIMLRLANVGAGDTVFDLGCGDGRILIAAVRLHNARGVCVDIDPRRIAESRDNARRAGVADRIEFRNEDLLTADLAGASVVMLFLSPELNRRVRPRLLRDLRPGARVVSHWHDMGSWKPERVVRVTSEGTERPLYLWIIRERER